MPDGSHIEVGAVSSLWRYPVKSMIGEELNVARLSNYGLFGDRVYALMDRFEGKVATAKNPRKWPTLFAFAANFVERSGSSPQASTVRIRLPDGTVVNSDQSDINQVLSKAINREVTLAAIERGDGDGAPPSVTAFPTAKAEEYWPDIDGLDHRDAVTDFELPRGTFFDCSTVHLLTTATLDTLRQSYPQGRFEVRRFRPNIVVTPVEGTQTFCGRFLDR